MMFRPSVDRAEQYINRPERYHDWFVRGYESLQPLDAKIVVVGQENIDPKSHVVVTSNHELGPADPFALGITWRKYTESSLIFAARDIFYRNRVAAYILKSCGALPIGDDKPGNTRQYMRDLQEAGKTHSLGVFMSSALTPKQVIPIPEDAPIFIASVLRLPLQPVAICGETSYMKPAEVLKLSNMRELLSHMVQTVYVNVGEPMDVSKLGRGTAPRKEFKIELQKNIERLYEEARAVSIAGY